MLELRNITIAFRQGILRRTSRPVLDDVSLALDKGEVLGIIGDSGSGKTTIARIAARLVNPDSGRVLIDGEDITGLSARGMARYRSRLQLVFQSPEGALDPEMTLGESLREAAAKSQARRKGIDAAIQDLCAEFGIKRELLSRYPMQVSGGEIQRVALSRALVFDPDYIILDEPTSMLDASVQAHILTALVERQKETGMGMALITHDLDVIRAICTRLVVLDGGRVIADGDVDDVLSRPDGYIHRYVSDWDMLSKLSPYIIVEDDGDEGRRRPLHQTWGGLVRFPREVLQDRRRIPQVHDTPRSVGDAPVRLHGRALHGRGDIRARRNRSAHDGACLRGPG